MTKTRHTKTYSAHFLEPLEKSKTDITMICSHAGFSPWLSPCMRTLKVEPDLGTTFRDFVILVAQITPDPLLVGLIEEHVEYEPEWQH
jgi:hypothetical protein